MKDALRLPEDFVAPILETAFAVDRVITYDRAQAYRLSLEELSLLRQAEGASGRRLHKGHALHNIGVSLYLSAPVEARLYFAAAHVEDVRLYPRRRSRHWGYLAERVLRSVFRVDSAGLSRLARLARPSPRSDPLEVAAQWAEDQPPTWQPFLVEQYDEEALRAMPATELVFVGGSYRYAPDRLPLMAEGVIRAGKTPVVVAQFPTRSGESNREKSFRILDLCGYAVFDGSVNDTPGWWPEVDHIAGQPQPIPTLIAIAVDRPDRNPEVSGMLPSAKEIPRLHVAGSGGGEHLRDFVAWWLGREDSHRLGAPLAFVVPPGTSGLPTPGSATYGYGSRGSNSPYEDLASFRPAGPVPSGGDYISTFDDGVSQVANFTVPSGTAMGGWQALPSDRQLGVGGNPPEVPPEKAVPKGPDTGTAADDSIDSAGNTDAPPLSADAPRTPRESE